jgi:hypothetical protein
MRGIIFGLIVGAFLTLIFQPYVFPDGLPSALQHAVRDLFGWRHRFLAVEDLAFARLPPAQVPMIPNCQ